jgi:DUF971 family protein
MTWPAGLTISRRERLMDRELRSAFAQVAAAELAHASLRIASQSAALASCECIRILGPLPIHSFETKKARQRRASFR